MSIGGPNEGNELFDYSQFKDSQDDSSSTLSGLLYGVVQWFNGNPVLDGMPYFETKRKALDYADEQEKLGSFGHDVSYTIIRLKKSV